MKKRNNLNFRNIVRSRDNWMCQKCGRIEYLQAHHFDAPKDYPLFANLPDNGITLCVYCHADAHPEVPRNLFIANVIKAEKEGCISAGKLAKELNVNPRTIVRRAVRLDILKPMQKWMFTEEEAELLRQHSQAKKKKVKKIKKVEEKTRKIYRTVTLDLEDDRKLIELAAKDDENNISRIVRTAIREYLHKQRNKE